MCLKQQAQFYRLLIVVEIFGHCVLLTENDAYSVFSYLVNEYHWNCQEKINDSPMSGGNPNECCGFCNNQQYCSSSGTCCLGFYFDFEEALSSEPKNL